MLALVVGAGLGQAQKHIRMANAEARASAQERLENEEDEKAAKACRDAGGMPIWGCFTGKLAGCSPLPKK
jgi:hypothetical protein